MERLTHSKREFVPRSQRKKKFGGRFRPYLITALILLIIIFAYSTLFSNSSAFNFVFSQNALKSTNDRVNILLLGIGGGNHDGADLTDSIIVASYSLKTHQVTMFSIPRDLYLPPIKEKINAAYEIGKSKGGSNLAGLQFAEDKIDDILGIPIHYGVLMDFSSFSKAVDQVGGVDVAVPDTFDDYEYPIAGKEDDLCGLTQKEMDISSDQAKQLGVSPGKQQVYLDSEGKIATDSATLSFPCRFMHIHFDEGITHMNGGTALEFVRSRHALGIEGSDFARSKRQQLVIQAFREKALSIQTLSNPGKVGGLLSAFGSGVVTDIPQTLYPQTYSLTKNVVKVNSVVLGDLGGGKSLFINPPLDQYGGSWVLTPPNGDFKQVSDFVANTLNPPPPPSPSPSPTAKK